MYYYLLYLVYYNENSKLVNNFKDDYNASRIEILFLKRCGSFFENNFYIYPLVYFGSQSLLHQIELPV